MSSGDKEPFEQIDEEKSGWSSRRDSQISVEDAELIAKLENDEIKAFIEMQ